MTDPSAAERAAAIERARALMAERRVESPPPASAADTIRPKPDPHPAAASRIMTAGVAASAGMMLVAAMAASAQAGDAAPVTPAAPQVVHRVVTIELPVQAVAPAATEATQVRDVAALPAPAEAPAPAPAESEGS